MRKSIINIMKKIFRKFILRKKGEEIPTFTEDGTPFNFKNAFEVEEVEEEKHEESDPFLIKINDCLRKIKELAYNDYETDIVYLQQVSKDYLKMKQVAISLGEEDFLDSLFSKCDIVAYAGLTIEKAHIYKNMEYIDKLYEAKGFNKKNESILNKIDSYTKDVIEVEYQTSESNNIGVAVSLLGEILVLRYPGFESDASWLQNFTEYYTKRKQEQIAIYGDSFSSINNLEKEHLKGLQRKVEYIKEARNRAANPTVVKVRKVKRPAYARVLTKK